MSSSLDSIRSDDETAAESEIETEESDTKLLWTSLADEFGSERMG
uniref:Uncharacterized protein n=1 Tax=Arundo donax TaxID=35708 RepID=A0A0A9C7L9_ARUDO